MREALLTLGSLRCRVLQENEGTPALGVFLCHGFGAPGDDLVPLAEELCAQRPGRLGSVRFVFPEAPLDLSSLGMPGARAWWNIDVGRFQRAAFQGMDALLALCDQTPEGLAPARRQLHAALDAFSSMTGLGLSRLVLGGFSQGAMLATDLCLRLEEPPAALAIFSGTLVSASEWTKRAPARAGLEVIQAHGRSDPLLPFALAERLHSLLEQGGLRVDFLPFPGPHTIPAAALAHLGTLLERKLESL